MEKLCDGRSAFDVQRGRENLAQQIFDALLGKYGFFCGDDGQRYGRGDLLGAAQAAPADRVGYRLGPRAGLNRRRKG